MARTVLTLLFLLGFFLPAAAFAQTGNPAYIVQDVKVDTLAESAVKARDKAFGEAQMAAFRKLAERYFTPAEMETFTPPDARTVAGMVQDFEVISEQLSTKRYVGTYTFRFKANAVNHYFGKTPQYTEQGASSQRAGLMILPFFQQGTATALWDARKNPWLASWQKTDKSGNPALVLPLGDVSDMMDVRDDQAISYNPAGLRRMLSRYNAREAVIVLAKFDQTASPPLTIEIYRTDRKIPELLKTISVPITGEKVLSDLLDKAVIKTKEVLDGNWKLETIVEDGADPDAEDVAVAPAEEAKPYKPQAGEVRVQARFASISEWLNIRRSLNGIPALTNVKIVALKSNEAAIDLTYADWPSLKSGLEAKGLQLSGSGAGDYHLMMRQQSGFTYR